VIEDYFENIDTQEKAYWLGFMFADGNVSIQPSGRKAINISQKEAGHPASFLRCIDSTYEAWRCTKGDYEWYRAQVYSEKMFADLVSHGCVPAKSLILDGPIGVPPELENHFIRGYNDGDGGFYTSQKRIRMRGTEKFLTWINSKLPVAGLLYPQGPTAQLFVCRRAHRNIVIDYLYNDATLYLERKKLVADELRIL
jgi:hypothetical protein